MPEPTPETVSAKEAARRALCLAALIRRGAYEMGPPPQVLQAKGGDASQIVRNAVKNLNDWLKAEKLWDALSPMERELMAQPSGTIPEQQLINISWRAEALTMLNWSLGHLSQLPNFDRGADQDNAPVTMPVQEATNAFIGAARLRPDAEIHAARDSAEFWHWRARTYKIQRAPDEYKLPPGVSLDDIVRSAAAKGHEDGLFVAIDQDFPAFGKAYRDLTEDEWRLINSITRERHYALNWLCEPGTPWDDVTTHT